jgi:hypothetical protein
MIPTGPMSGLACVLNFGTDIETKINEPVNQ